jgi:hypothetical protein
VRVQWVLYFSCELLLPMDIEKAITAHNKINRLVFDAKRHKYYVKGEEYESVTQRINRFFVFDAQKTLRIIAEKNWVLEEDVMNHWNHLRDRGSMIHELAENYCRGLVLNEEEREIVKHVIAFLEDSDYEIIATEKKIFSKKYKIAGTIDLILKTGDRIYLLDWKTSKKEIKSNSYFQMAKPPFNEIPNNKFHVYSLQLATYIEILKEEYNVDVWDSLIVHLKDDGSYLLVEPLTMLEEAKILLGKIKK